MRIDLARTLAAAAEPRHEPTTVTAERVLARARRTRRNHLLRWLLPLLAAVTALGLLIWFTPRLTRGPLPAPASSPTPSSEFHWDGTDQTQTVFSDEEVARRCRITKTETVLADESTLQPGGIVKIIPAGATVTKGKDGFETDPPGTRICQLGWDTTPTADRVTIQEVSAPQDQLPALCERHSGLSLTGPDWHLAASLQQKTSAGGQESRFAAFTSDSGWFALCRLDASSQPGTTSPDGSAYQTIAQVVRLTEVEEQQPAIGCPSIMIFGGGTTTTGSTTTTSDVSISALSPIMSYGRIDASITSIDLVGPKGWGMTLRLPVIKGIVLTDQQVHLTHPMPVGSNGEMPASTLRLRNAAGQVVRTCTTKS